MAQTTLSVNGFMNRFMTPNSDLMAFGFVLHAGDRTPDEYQDVLMETDATLISEGAEAIGFPNARIVAKGPGCSGQVLGFGLLFLGN